MLFALSRNLRDFSPVTNCRPRLPACQPASQPSSTPSRTRTRARGTKTSPPPSASAVPTVSNFPIAFWPRRRDLWALCKVGGIRSEFTQPLSTLCLRIISEYQLMLRARFVSSRFVISSFLPSFLASLFFGLLNLESVRRPWIDFRLSNRFANQDLNFHTEHSEGITSQVVSL